MGFDVMLKLMINRSELQIEKLPSGGASGESWVSLLQQTIKLIIAVPRKLGPHPRESLSLWLAGSRSPSAR